MLVSPVTAYVTGSALYGLRAPSLEQRPTRWSLAGRTACSRPLSPGSPGSSATITLCEDGSKFEEVNPGTGVPDPAYSGPANQQYLFETWQMIRLGGHWAISVVSPVTLPTPARNPASPYRPLTTAGDFADAAESVTPQPLCPRPALAGRPRAAPSSTRWSLPATTAWTSCPSKRSPEACRATAPTPVRPESRRADAVINKVFFARIGNLPLDARWNRNHVAVGDVGCLPPPNPHVPLSCDDHVPLVDVESTEFRRGAWLHQLTRNRENWIVTIVPHLDHLAARGQDLRFLNRSRHTKLHKARPHNTCGEFLSPSGEVIILPFDFVTAFHRHSGRGAVDLGEPGLQLAQCHLINTWRPVFFQAEPLLEITQDVLVCDCGLLMSFGSATQVEESESACEDSHHDARIVATRVNVKLLLVFHAANAEVPATAAREALSAPAM